jgi:hypothetical protein
MESWRAGTHRHQRYVAAVGDPDNLANVRLVVWVSDEIGAGPGDKAAIEGETLQRCRVVRYVLSADSAGQLLTDDGANIGCKHSRSFTIRIPAAP